MFVKTSDGKVFCWGENNCSQLGLGDNNKKFTPTELKIEGEQIKDIICGEFFTFAICKSKKIFCFGSNVSGQLGLGDENERNIPIEFKIKDEKIKDIIC